MFGFEYLNKTSNFVHTKEKPKYENSSWTQNEFDEAVKLAPVEMH